MTDPQPPEKRRGFLSKHKWTIVLSTVAGLVVAAAVHFFHVPTYQSQAKLLLRYVVDRSPVDGEGNGRGEGRTSDDLVATEVEILTSADLALDVAETIRDQWLRTANAESTRADASAAVTSGLEVTSRPGSSVILLSYKHRDPKLVKFVLEELLKQYFSKHLEIHRTIGASDFVQQQIDGVKMRLRQTEDSLRTLKRDHGITTSAQSTASLTAVVAKAEDDLRATETELAQQRARVQTMEKLAAQASSEATRSGSDSDPDRPADLATEQIRLAEVEAKVEHLKTQLRSLQERSERLSEILPQIADLERSKALEEDNYRKFGASLERARMDQALDPSQMPNISIIESPTAPQRRADERNKITLLLLASGAALGMVVAAGSEYRSVLRRRLTGQPDRERS